MRWIPLLIVAASCWWTWHVWEERGREALEAAPSVAAPPLAEARGEGAAETLGARLWGRPEPAPDRLVHCRIGDEGTFLRESECARRDGAIDEPDWARLD